VSHFLLFCRLSFYDTEGRHSKLCDTEYSYAECRVCIESRFCDAETRDTECRHSVL